MKRSLGPATAGAARPNRRRGKWRLLGALATVVLAAGIALTWFRSAPGVPSRAELPQPPELAGWPAIFRERLAQAEAKARVSNTRLEGVAELGRLYHANGFPSEAAACWQLLRAHEPDEARWCYYLADAQREAGNSTELDALLEATLRLAPGYAPARLQLADLRFKTGDATAAAHHYRLRLTALPADPYARLGLARVALQQRQTGEARRLVEALLQDAPTFSTGHTLYAEILTAAGEEAEASRHRWLGTETLRYRAAADPWRDELSDWCFDYDRLCLLGTIEVQTENDEAARAFFTRAIRLQPVDSQAYELLADLRLKRQDAAGARDLLEGAQPHLTGKVSAVFFITLSAAYRALHQPDPAIRVASLGLERTGRSPEMLHALGQALADSGQHVAALKVWDEALAQNPHDADMNYHRALSLLARHELDAALEALDRSLTHRPTYLPTLLLRGQIELEADHLDLAEKYLRPAFASHPADPQARRFLAEWHLRTGAKAEARGDAHQAEENYRSGLILDGDQATLLLRLGAFYVAHQRATEALVPLTRHQTLFPDNAAGCLFLGQAYALTAERDKAGELLVKGLKLAEQAGDTKTAAYCRQILARL